MRACELYFCGEMHQFIVDGSRSVALSPPLCDVDKGIIKTQKYANKYVKRNAMSITETHKQRKKKNKKSQTETHVYMGSHLIKSDHQPIDKMFNNLFIHSIELNHFQHINKIIYSRSFCPYPKPLTPPLCVLRVVAYSVACFARFSLHLGESMMNIFNLWQSMLSVVFPCI